MSDVLSEGVADALVAPRFLLPVAPASTVMEDWCVAIRDGAIIEVGRVQRSRPPPGAVRTELDHHVVMPGPVNAHAHLAMALLRGLGDSEPLEAWLDNTIWPLEHAWRGADFVRDGTRLAVAEMLASGPRRHHMY